MPHTFLRRRNSLKSLHESIFSHIYTPVADLNVAAWWSKEPLPFSRRMSGKKIAVAIGKKWGNLFDCAWFRFTGRVPASAAGRETVLLIDVSGEGCVYDVRGNPVLGLTSRGSEFAGTFGPTKRAVPLSKKAKGGEEVDVWVDAGCNGLFGNLLADGVLKEACVAVVNREMWDLYFDAEVLWGLMMELPEESARGQQILFALHRASLAMNDYTAEEARTARAILAPELAKRGGDPSLQISAVGHAHIDLAWLWPVRETKRKGARTFATALALMERYPEYVFGQSQPQIYQWMKEEHPALYRRIKRRVAEGRWEPQGCMWVEADTNITGGESLVRQILHGKRFFRREFGKDIRYLWLPDVFGYSGALPQILKKSGVDCFTTQKLSWSVFNKFPHHTFYWKGIDGTRVLAHLLPDDDYNGTALPLRACYAERNYKDKAVCGHCLMLFGIGDGGGGPGAEHLERLKREKNLQGMPPIRIAPAEEFWPLIDREDAPYAEWAGELYLERHQGTYTTQARNKRFNRKMELALRDCEIISVMAEVMAGVKYPAQALERIWKEVLLYQFHDVLPGSSITRVYDESLERYEQLLAQTESLTASANAALAGATDTDGAKKPALVMNTLSWDRTEWLQASGQWREVFVPAMGWEVIDLGGPPQAPAIENLSASASQLENDFLRVKFDKEGWIVSVFDKTSGREAIAEGACANCLTVYRDEGDAWDFPETSDLYAERPTETFRLESSKARLDGPRAILRQTRAYGSSRLTQEIILTEGSARLEFVTEVGWREKHRMLRVLFPVAVLATEATCEIQYGNLKRPTHRNTSWEQGKMEICAHKWIDLSEPSYGVALLNDCKYGHRVVGNTMDINLLRSPCHPDPVADRARHQFTYALYSHPGDSAKGCVVQEAYKLNVPLRVIPCGAPHPASVNAHARRRGKLLSGYYSLLSVETIRQPSEDEEALFPWYASHVIVETIKKSEDGDAIIARLYEITGAQRLARIQFGFPVKSVALVDMMEENPKPLKVKNGAVEIAFGPFEIHTLRIQTA